MKKVQEKSAQKCKTKSKARHRIKGCRSKMQAKVQDIGFDKFAGKIQDIRFNKGARQRCIEY